MTKQNAWNIRAKRLLKSEMVKRGISNEDLSGLLCKMGVEYSKSSIDSKISRGTFSATFMIQCFAALNCKSVGIEQIIEGISEYEK